MLRVVRQSQPPEEDRPGAVVEYQPPERSRAPDDEPLYYRPRRRSVGARVRATTRLAILVAGVAAIAYFGARSSVLDTVLASFTSGDSPSPVVADVAPEEVAATRAAPLKPVSVPVQAVVPAPPAATLPMPDVMGLVSLIRSAVVALQQANVSGNYAVLREMAATDFRERNTPASLSETFTGLRERGTDLGQITVVNPRLYTQPTIDEKGLLRLAGFFQAGAEKIDFEMAFQVEGRRWRLYGIGLHPPKDMAPPVPKAPVAGKVPDAADLVTLIRGAVLSLNQANNTGDYSVLRDLAAPGFQQANSLVKLGTLFASLRGRGLDLSPVAVIDPKLSRPPAIDKNGYLRLSGFFPSRPEQVNFELVFALSDGAWRLFGIGLETSPISPAVASDAPPG